MHGVSVAIGRGGKLEYDGLFVEQIQQRGEVLAFFPNSGGNRLCAYRKRGHFGFKKWSEPEK